MQVLKSYNNRDNKVKYLGVTLNEDNNNQTDLQQRIKMLTKHTLWYRKFLKIKTCQTN